MKKVDIQEYIRFKIHGGKVEDLSPEIQARLAQVTSDSRIKKEAVKNCESCGHVLEKVTRGYYCWHCGDETLVTHEKRFKEEA